LLLDQRLGTVAVAHAQENTRTAFFAFPLETLTPEARTTLIGRTLLWLSPLGDSQLTLPPTAEEGSRLPITLTVGSATTETLTNVQVTLPLLTQMTLEPGSLSGGWGYDPFLNQLTWAGDLAPGQKVVFQAEVQLASSIPDGINLSLRAILDAGNRMILTSDAEVWVDVPWLVADMHANPDIVRPGQPTGFSLHLQNIGAVTATLQLTDTLPTALTLITPSLQTTSGDVLAHWGWIEWNGLIPPGSSVWISYTQTAGFWNPVQPQGPWVEIEAPYQFLGAWVPVWMEGQVYFPWIGRP
ncbi:MAG TPA: hypothetical protein PK530_01635, partial [Anaerolineales bacterium]|nr:hypothetical protein [Anaerolineales bacterium]